MRYLLSPSLLLLLVLPSYGMTFVNEAHAGADGTSSSTVAISATAHTTGNLLTLGVGWTDASNTITVVSVTDTAGNTWTAGMKANNSSTSSQMWFARNITGNANNIVTVTFSSATTYRRLVVVKYSGTNITSPLDVEATPNTGSSTSPISNSFTTTNANDQIVAFATVSGNTTPGIGYAMRTSNVGNLSAMEDKHLTSAQTAINASIATDTNGAWNMHAMVFKDSAEPPLFVDNITGMREQLHS